MSVVHVCRIVLAIHELDRDEEGKFAVRKLRVQKKPTLSVFTNNAVPKGKLRLCPLTDKATKLGAKRTPAQMICVIDGEEYALHRLFDEKKVVSEFWILDTTTDKKKANMILETWENPGVEFPCAVNSRALTAGEQLWLHKPETEKPEKRKPVSCELDAKSKKAKF